MANPRRNPWLLLLLGVGGLVCLLTGGCFGLYGVLFLKESNHHVRFFGLVWLSLAVVLLTLAFLIFRRVFRPKEASDGGSPSREPPHG